MKLERHLKLSTSEPSPSRVRIAFATRDRKHVDQHFGSACSFMIYNISPLSHELVEVAEFAKTEQDKNHSKLLTKLELLQGCQAVYSNAIGSAAIRQLLSLGIQPVRSIPGTPISREIAQLQEAWEKEPPIWLEKQIRSQQRPSSRFDEMEDEGWQE